MPAWLPFAIAGAQIASAGVSAAGSIKSGKAARAAAEYNAKIKERNAKVAEQAAEQVLAQSDRDALVTQNIASKFISSQMVGYRKAGVVASTGTALKVALDSANNADEKIALGKYQAKVNAITLREQAVDARLGASLAIAEGQAAEQASKFQAISSLLGGSAKAAMAFR